MTEFGALLLVIYLVYLFECLALISPDEFVFHESMRGAWKLRPPSKFPHFWARVMAFKSPFPPLNGIALCSSMPFAITTDEICTNPNSFDPLPRSVATIPSSLRFSEVNQFYSEGKSVLADKNTLLKTSSEVHAYQLAQMLEQLRQSPSSEREKLIQYKLGETLDSDLVERRLKTYRQLTTISRFASNILFVNLLILVPATLWFRGLDRAWPSVLASLFTNSLIIAYLFVDAHQCLFPGKIQNRWTMAATILLSPPFAIRANDLILRDVFYPFHPVCVARALCSHEDFLETASRAIREARFPLRREPETVGHTSSITMTYWEQRVRDALDSFISGCGITRERLLTPPPPNSGRSNSYCPRCLAQYALSLGECSDCPGVNLLEFSNKVR